MNPQPKSPASRNANLRQLANGETCCVCMGQYCDSATTVWAHTNSLADGKGLAMKSSDHLGFFAGYHCHAMIDQGRLSAEEKSGFVLMAQTRTKARLEEIASDPLTREWKRKAARWALERLEND